MTIRFERPVGPDADGMPIGGDDDCMAVEVTAAWCQLTHQTLRLPNDVDLAIFRQHELVQDADRAVWESWLIVYGPHAGKRFTDVVIGPEDSL
jgi:hypothetical protein